MKKTVHLASLPLFALLLMASAYSASQSDFLLHYKGTPYHDPHYQGGPQAIPGKVLPAYYDPGGEGVAYHDSDAKNNGSGALNPANGTYLNEFRMNEGVDTSYTKFNLDPKIDDNPYDKAIPPANLLYVGWTVPGEWFNVTVQVAQPGDYIADLLYSSNRGGTISLDINGVPATARSPSLQPTTPPIPSPGANGITGTSRLPSPNSISPPENPSSPSTSSLKAK